MAHIAQGKVGTVSMQVKGPVQFHLETTEGDVEVTSGGNTISISGPGCAPSNVKLDHSGDDVEAELDVNECRGPLKVQLPSGSRVNVSTMSGNISLHGQFDDVELNAVSGNVSVDRVNNASIETVAGDVTLNDAAGRVKASTVQGNARISMSGSAPQMKFESASGNLVWSGLCGQGCRLKTEVFSGTTELKLDPRSSFSFKYQSRNGDLKDDLGVKAERDGRANQVRGTFGGGAGVVGVESFSGNVHFTRR